MEEEEKAAFVDLYADPARNIDEQYSVSRKRFSYRNGGKSGWFDSRTAACPPPC